MITSAELDHTTLKPTLLKQALNELAAARAHEDLVVRTAALQGVERLLGPLVGGLQNYIVFLSNAMQAHPEYRRTVAKWAALWKMSEISWYRLRNAVPAHGGPDTGPAESWDRQVEVLQGLLAADAMPAVLAESTAALMQASADLLDAGVSNGDMELLSGKSRQQVAAGRGGERPPAGKQKRRGEPLRHATVAQLRQDVEARPTGQEQAAWRRALAGLLELEAVDPDGRYPSAGSGRGDD